ncbi:PAS domain S-box protein [candidate division KSB1 bacterium]|nr:PAS domain S-box protein [candidate division KSB1 bacterium]
MYTLTIIKLIHEKMSISTWRIPDFSIEHYVSFVLLLALIITNIIWIYRFLSYKKRSNLILNQLHQKNRLYFRLSENVNQMILIVDESHRIVDANNYASSLLHYSKRELRKTNFKNLIPSEYWPQLAPTYIRDAMIGRNTERILINKEEERLPVHVYTVEFTYHDQTFFIEYYTDTAALDRANLISRFIDDKFRAVFDLSLNSIVVTNENEKILDCNSSFETMTGFRKSEVLNKKITLILKCQSHNDFIDSDLKQGHVSGINRYSAQTVSNCTIQKKSQGSVSAFFNRAIIEFGSEKRIFYFINEIVSDQMVKEELKSLKFDLQRFYKTSNDLIFILNTDQSIAFANDRVLSLLGYDHNALTQMKFCDVVGTEYVEYWKLMFQSLELEKKDIHISLVLKTVNDRPLYVEGSLYVKQIEADRHVYGIFTDVSEILKTIDALKQSQKRYLDIYDNAPEMYFSVDANGIIRLVNKYGAEYLGYSKEELIGRSVYDVIYPEDIDLVKNQMQQIIDRKEEKSQLEFRKVKKDGSILFVDENVRFIPDENGEPHELRIFCADNTRHKATIQALKESEEKYRKLIEQSNDAIYLLYNDRFELVNKKFEEILGYTQDDVEQPNFNVMNLVAPSSESMVKKRRDSLADAQDKGDRYEFTAVTKKGGHIEVEVSVYHIDYNGGVATQGILRDVTERKRMEKELKESETYFRSVFQGAKDAILVESIDGQIYDVNDAACRLYGYTKTELVRLSVTDLLPPTMLEKLPEIKSAHSSGHGFYLAEAENIHCDGHMIPVEVSTSVVQIDHVPRIIAVVRDITERKIAEREKLEGIRLTVSALAKAIELRDPHTYGHSAKVATIAEIIARELSWSEDKILGLRLAAELHDIGKIAIPAEILGKPAKLNELEYTIVQEHVQKGYEILKDIQFPFPVAEAVYQHHELLDGSGYPRGLKGSDIIEEARIIGIADILETFTSHRPYRPALGLNTAMEMLTRESGRLYDETIVQLVAQLVARSKGERFWKV